MTAKKAQRRSGLGLGKNSSVSLRGRIKGSRCEQTGQGNHRKSETLRLVAQAFSDVAVDVDQRINAGIARVADDPERLIERENAQIDDILADFRGQFVIIIKELAYDEGPDVAVECQGVIPVFTSGIFLTLPAA